MNTRRPYYKSVASLGLETDTYSIPSGKKLRIMQIGGNAGSSPDTLVCIMYDQGGANEEIIFSTHGDGNPPIDRTLDGDTTLKIILDNDTASAESMGGYWNGQLG